jgi:hypothetical protein
MRRENNVSPLESFLRSMRRFNSSTSVSGFESIEKWILCFLKKTHLYSEIKMTRIRLSMMKIVFNIFKVSMVF